MLWRSFCKQLGRLEVRLGPHHFLPENRLYEFIQALGTISKSRESLVQFRILEMLRETAEDLVGDSETTRL